MNHPTDVCTDAAAFVLGALEPDDRRAFEEHLAGCADCRATVADLAGVPGLLARVSPTDLADPPRRPDTLWPRLLRVVRRQRRRRLLSMGAVAASVALVVGLGTALVVHRDDDTPATPGQPMTALVSSPVRATAAVSATSGGSRVWVQCIYNGAPDAVDYVLVVTNRQGAERTVATWEVGPDHEAEVSGSVPWPPSAVARVEIRLSDGEPLLRLAHPA